MQPSLGKMSAYKILNWQDRAASSIEQTVAAFLEIGEAIATRWIQTAKGVLLLQLVPGDDASGAIYVFDRRCDQWFMLSFEECEESCSTPPFRRGGVTRTAQMIRHAPESVSALSGRAVCLDNCETSHTLRILRLADESLR